MGTEEYPHHKQTENLHIPTIHNQQMVESTEITEECPLGQRNTPPPQSIDGEIPSQSVQDSPEDFVRINILPTPKRVNFTPMNSPGIATLNESSSSTMRRDKSSFKNLLPRLSFKFKNSSSDIVDAAILALGSPSSVKGGRPRMTRTFSLSKLFSTPKGKKASSLPVTPIAHSNPGSTHGSNKGRLQLPIHRAHSVPDLIKEGSVRRFDSLGGMFRVIPTTPRVKDGTLTASIATLIDADEIDDNGEDIHEDEAVCRICFVELGEGSETLKMECSCKGELALVHQECAVKWFSIRGNKICEVCEREVQNLPVTLLRIQNAQDSQRNRGEQAELANFRVWQDVPVLVIVSMLAYFGFLEQLLIKKMGTGAIAISLPFSCILGLLASMTSTTMVGRKFLWVYAVSQFVMVVVFAHISYSLLHLQAVVSVIIATFVGFGVAMCGCSIIFEILRWRRIWRARSNTEPSAVNGISAPISETTRITQPTPIQPELMANRPSSPGA
ncbi:uncharacterized protein LOC130827625 [Amaranthus tricolor]|uniref:uncharacterized protein LOC130827625 n=1 Tax=Amaranthus tricolor TaxID=29722 RepID=UPI00258AA633|nr:uncharacterized protein LOC130827625 [Amaranthus tricolor]